MELDWTTLYCCRVGTFGWSLNGWRQQGPSLELRERLLPSHPVDDADEQGIVWNATQGVSAPLAAVWFDGR